MIKVEENIMAAKNQSYTSRDRYFIMELWKFCKDNKSIPGTNNNLGL